jgi:hypothetical protein
MADLLFVVFTLLFMIGLGLALILIDIYRT